MIAEIAVRFHNKFTEGSSPPPHVCLCSGGLFEVLDQVWHVVVVRVFFFYLWRWCAASAVRFGETLEGVKRVRAVEQVEHGGV